MVKEAVDTEKDAGIYQMKKMFVSCLVAGISSCANNNNRQKRDVPA